MNKIKTQLADPNRILTVANIISLLRAIMAIPIINSLQNQYWNIAFILIIIAVLSDALDGYFARRANEVTHFGQWLDPIADFIVILAVTSYLVMEGIFPIWFYWFFLVRYVAIASPAIYFLIQHQFILSSNWYGKWAAGITACAIVLHIYSIEPLNWLPDATLYIASVLLIVSFIKYIRIFLNISKTH